MFAGVNADDTQRVPTNAIITSFTSGLTAMIDLGTLTFTELQSLQSLLAAEISKRVVEGRKNVLKELKQLATERGFDLAELLSFAKPSHGAQRTSAPVKFRSGDGKEWSGRGRKPHWVNEHLAKGGQLNELAC